MVWKSESSLEGKEAWSKVVMGREGFVLVTPQAFPITHIRMYMFEWAFIKDRDDVAGLRADSFSKQLWEIFFPAHQDREAVSRHSPLQS